MVAFAATVGQQAIALGPQSFILNCLGMDRSEALFIQGFDDLGWNACYKAIGGNNGALGNNSTGSNDGALADNCTIQNGGMHADEAVILNRAGM